MTGSGLIATKPPKPHKDCVVQYLGYNIGSTKGHHRYYCETHEVEYSGKPFYRKAAK
jgi:hypothetical protein